MRRANVGLACVVMLMAAGCDSSPAELVADQTVAAPSTGTPPPAGTVCDRVRPTLAGDWKVEAKPSLINPIADSCWLTSTTDPKNRYHIAVGVLPLTKQDIVEVRRQAEHRLKERRYVVKAVDAGIGENSWSVNPAAEGPWLFFVSGGRMVRVAQETYGPGQLAAITAVAKTITTLPGGIPAVPKIIGRPECARATAAAEKVMGGKAMARRDTVVDGKVFCQWGSARSGVFTHGGGLASEAAASFNLVKGAGDDPATRARRVDVGQEGWQQDNGFLVYRIKKDLYVNVSSLPLAAKQSADIVALGKATVPIYNR